MRLSKLLLFAAESFERMQGRTEVQNRRVRDRLDELGERVQLLLSRGEILRLRAPILQDLLTGVLAASSIKRPSTVPSLATQQRPVLEHATATWPPETGNYDERGLVRSVGDLARLGVALTFEEVRAFLIGLTQETPVSPTAQIQIRYLAQTLIKVISEQSLDLDQYAAAWTRLVHPTDSPSSSSRTVPLGINPPPNVAAASSAGTSTSAAKEDHTHGHGDHAGGSLHALATAAAPGFMSSPDVTKLAGIAAGATKTPLGTNPPPDVATASNTGTSTSAAKEDHTHGHGNQAGGNLHALATGAASGFISAADFTKLAGIAAGATKTPLGTNPPPDVATASNTGTSTSAAKEDHTHGHGNQAGGNLHALATGAASGFISAADFTKLAGIAAGATRAGGQDLTLFADRTSDLLTNSVFGINGNVQLFTVDVVSEVCLIAGSAGQFRVEANQVTSSAVDIRVFKAPSGAISYLYTGISISIAAGARSGSSATTVTVAAGERLIGFSTGAWAHGGLTLRGRITP